MESFAVHSHVPYLVIIIQHLQKVSVCVLYFALKHINQINHRSVATYFQSNIMWVKGFDTSVVRHFANLLQWVAQHGSAPSNRAEKLAFKVCISLCCLSLYHLSVLSLCIITVLSLCIISLCCLSV